MSTKEASVEIVFGDIVNLSDRGIQLTLLKMDTKDLAIALKGAKKVIQDRIFSNLSHRVGTMIKEEMESSGRIAKGDTEAARMQMVEIVQQTKSS